MHPLQNSPMVRPTQLLHPARQAAPARPAATVLLLRDSGVPHKVVAPAGRYRAPGQGRDLTGRP